VKRHPNATDLAALLAALAEAQVEFIVVGGVAAVLHGVPVITKDLDIVHRRTAENVERLLGVLLRLDAVFRYDLAGRDLRPTAALLLGKGQINLSTSLGPMCELGEGQGYDELLSRTELVTGDGPALRVLDLPTLIEVKAKLGRAKDRLMLPVLVATLEEREKNKQPA
jgi:hypothetical protein